MEGLRDKMDNVEQDDGVENMENQLHDMLGDADSWETPSRAPKKKSEKRQRGAMVSVRLTPAELARVQQAADREGLTVSAFVRSRALRASSAGLPAHQRFVTRNTTFADADVIWRKDVDLEVSPFFRSRALNR